MHSHFEASPEAAPQYRAPYFQLLEFQPTQAHSRQLKSVVVGAGRPFGRARSQWTGQAVGAEAAISVPLFKLKEAQGGWDVG